MRFHVDYIAEHFELELSKYLKLKGASSKEEVRKAREEFIPIYNRNRDMGLYDENAYTYLDLADQALDSHSKSFYAEMALELDPDLPYAKSMLIKEMYGTDPALCAFLMEEVLEEEEERLEDLGYTEETYAGRFFQNIETRPFLHLLNQYADVLDRARLFREEADAIEEILFLNPSDDMGTHPFLMGCYARLDEEEKALKLREQFKDADGDSIMLLPLAAMYYRRGDQEKAAVFVKELAEKNREIGSAVSKLIRGDTTDMYLLGRFPYVVPGTVDEFYRAYLISYDYYNEMPGFLPFIEEVLRLEAEKDHGDD